MVLGLVEDFFGKSLKSLPEVLKKFSQRFLKVFGKKFLTKKGDYKTLNIKSLIKQSATVLICDIYACACSFLKGGFICQKEIVR